MLVNTFWGKVLLCFFVSGFYGVDPETISFVAIGILGVFVFLLWSLVPLCHYTGIFTSTIVSLTFMAGSYVLGIYPTFFYFYTVLVFIGKKFSVIGYARDVLTYLISLFYGPNFSIFYWFLFQFIWAVSLQIFEDSTKYLDSFYHKRHFKDIRRSKKSKSTFTNSHSKTGR